MPLIRNGREAENHWTFVSDEDGLPEPAKLEHHVDRATRMHGDGEVLVALRPDTSALNGIVVTFSRLFSDGAALKALGQPIGVRLAPGDDPLALAPHLEWLSLIEIDFPKYTDGRGYSHAQLLRRRLGYTGELRAVGHVLRDQLLYMHRSGIDSYCTERADLSSLLEAMGEFSSFYQPAADRAQSVFAARHRS